MPKPKVKVYMATSAWYYGQCNKCKATVGAILEKDKDFEYLRPAFRCGHEEDGYYIPRDETTTEWRRKVETGEYPDEGFVS